MRISDWSSDVCSSDLLDEARDMLETVKDDEQAARENLPPSLEDSERAQAMDAAVSELESAISALEDLDADEIGTQLDTASEQEGLTIQPMRHLDRDTRRARHLAARTRPVGGINGRGLSTGTWDAAEVVGQFRGDIGRCNRPH